MRNISDNQGNISTNVFMENKALSVKAFLSMAPCFFFLYVNGVMIFTLRSKATFVETPRYILFGHLLYTDTLHLILCMFMYILAICRVYLTLFSCLGLITFGTVVVRVAPLNLAVMSLERYVAICFPLRHAEIATLRRTSVAIALMWIWAVLSALSETVVFFVIGAYTPKHIFCSRFTLFQLQIFVDINISFTVIYFVSVGIIILYTYISIIRVTQSVISEKLSSHKAQKTVLLHLIQFFLCLASILSDNFVNDILGNNTDRLVAINIRYVFFVILIIFPRCLTPLIYGLRDHAFNHLFKMYFFFGVIGSRRSVEVERNY